MVWYWYMNGQTIQQNKIYLTTYKTVVYDKRAKIFFFKQMLLGQLDSHSEKDKIRSIPHTTYRNILKMEINVKNKTIRVVEESMCKFLYNLMIRKGFLNTIKTPDTINLIYLTMQTQILAWQKTPQAMPKKMAGQKYL